MCGIGGVYCRPAATLDIRAICERMLAHQYHRGPDGSGVWLASTSHVGLCHNRLAILDLSPQGVQPMTSADGALVIVFNGEIYNWQALRARFMGQGISFRTGTDTEVLLAAYEEWGVEMLSHLRGMFAFALYDARTDVLFCARDRVGKKPFVYTETPTGFAFGSEIPAVLSMPGCDRELNREALAGMLLHNVRHIVDPHTAYRGIKRLRSGHAMLVRGGRIEKSWQYWRPQLSISDITPCRLREKLEEAVQLRMVADVPVGAMLSGGVDSSAIAAMMTQHSREPIRTYALGFDADDEDLRRARVMATHLGCTHKEIYFDADRQWDVFRKLIHVHGEPIMLLPLIHAYELCEAIRDDGVKVVLGGHGADELFYGYTGHVRTARLSAIMAAVGPFARMAASMIGTSRSPLLSLLAAPPGERKALFYRHCEARDWSAVLNPDARVTMHNVVADELAYWGRACPSRRFIDESNFCALLVENTHSVTISSDLPPMLASVEMRAPFLDQEIIDFALATPVRKKVPWIAPLNRLKWILRQAVRDLVPHEQLFAPKRGFGFGVPQDEVLRGPWRGHGDELFASPHDAGGLFDPNALRTAWQEFKLHGSGGSNVVPN
ncbi:MAG: asparagine synthase (glutamine-hydrolyzing), partial [Rhodocyclaceae bacterium]|nr:asparagine synthase (glutamine-hydrolyzing) [Rhodocyclaceae bacterium]